MIKSYNYMQMYAVQVCYHVGYIPCYARPISQALVTFLVCQVCRKGSTGVRIILVTSSQQLKKKKESVLLRPSLPLFNVSFFPRLIQGKSNLKAAAEFS